MLYNRLGDMDEAEGLLCEVMTAHPELHDIAYSLGLLLAEKRLYDEAVLYLAKAVQGMPEGARVHYNLGVLLDRIL
jgi:tetratricopeptide (TPR) repeat protein